MRWGPDTTGYATNKFFDPVRLVQSGFYFWIPFMSAKLNGRKFAETSNSDGSVTFTFKAYRLKTLPSRILSTVICLLFFALIIAIQPYIVFILGPLVLFGGPLIFGNPTESITIRSDGVIEFLDNKIPLSEFNEIYAKTGIRQTNLYLYRGDEPFLVTAGDKSVMEQLFKSIHARM